MNNAAGGASMAYLMSQWPYGRTAFPARARGRRRGQKREQETSPKAFRDIRYNLPTASRFIWPSFLPTLFLIPI